ncbi:MAG: beta-galactosidase [Lentisphaerota bacterium]
MELQNGYFYDAEAGEYFIAHGAAYQVWNPPVFANQTTNQVAYDLGEMKRMHVNSLRVEFTWSQVETHENSYDFSKTDFLVQCAQEKGVKLFILMGYQYPPGWFKTNYPERMGWHYDQYLNSTGLSDVLNYNSPEARAAYAGFVSNICARYKDYTCIGGWIVGNEFAYYDLWEPPDQYPSHRFLGFDTNYSVPSYHAFLSNKYEGAIASLNDRWATSYSGFEQIPIANFYPTNHQDQLLSQQSGYFDLIQWRKETIGEFLSAGIAAARQADTNHLMTYAMVGGIFSGQDDNNGCEDARAIVSICASNGTPLDFWTVNNYPWTWTGSEMRSMDYGITKYRELIGLPVMVSECGLSDNDTIFPETVYRQKGALASLPWEAVMSGALGAHIFHWNDRNPYRFYPNVLKREAGFGFIQDSRLVKDVYWNVLDAYRKMDELHIEKIFPGSADPRPDILAYWSVDSDLGFNRGNQELSMIWGAFKRMGFQVGIINELQFDAGFYTNAAALFVSRAFAMRPEHWDALETQVLAIGIHVHANADLPGQYDAYYRSNANWRARMESIFGLGVDHAVPGFESGNKFNNYIDHSRVFVSNVVACGSLNTNFSIQCWKIWHGVSNLSGTVIATHTGSTNTQPAMPALQYKTHAKAKAAIDTMTIGDVQTSTADSPYWEHTWDVRTMFVDAVYRQTFGMAPKIELSGDPYARYVLPDYRTCSNGSVLISLLNMNGPDHPMTNLVVRAPGLLNGKRVENLTRGGMVTNVAGDEITVSVSGDEFLLLYVYASDTGADASLVNTNRGKIWFMNGDGRAPSRIYPAPGWIPIQIGYDIPWEWDWENVRVALERVGAGSNVQYGLSLSNWVAPGSGSVWAKLPVRHADLDDPGYLSTPEGGRYVLSAWLEDMGEIHSRTEVPVELFWGVKPLTIPSEPHPETAYDITLEWQDVPSYLSDEGPCPVNRARQWPLTENDDVRQSYEVRLELLNTASNVLLSTNVITKLGSGQREFSVFTPAQTQTSDWWRATLISRPVTYDLIDSFEDRVPGNNKPWATNDAPMEVYLWGSYGGVASWWDEGIGLEPVTDGKQSEFLILQTKPSFSYSGHTYHFSLGSTNNYSSASLRSNIWVSADLCIQNTNQLGAFGAPIEIQLLAANGTKVLKSLSYTNAGSYQHFNCRLSEITSAPPWPGSMIDWTRVSALEINVLHTNVSTAYLFFLDNVRMTGTPVRVNTGGRTNAIYLSNGDLYSGPNPDRPPLLLIAGTNDSLLVDRAAPDGAQGTDFGPKQVPGFWTNRFSIMVDCDQNLVFDSVELGGVGADLFRVDGFPMELSPGVVASNFSVVFLSTNEGLHDATLTLQYGGTNFVICLRGQSYSLSQLRGPASGGTPLTITNLALGGASTITNVLVGGDRAEILGQGDNWICFLTPFHAAGQVDIVLQPLVGDTMTLNGVYDYNPPGSIGWIYYTPYSWTNLGAGVDAAVRALAWNSNGTLYAGGSFTMAGGLTSRYAAAWNGQSWTNLGPGLGNGVYALAADSNEDLYAGGLFTNAGGVNASYVARWNGQSWTNLGSGVNNMIYALAVAPDGTVYAGGDFTNAGSVGASRVTRWDGSSWSPLGEGLGNSVRCLAVAANGDVYASGTFTNAGSVGASRIARWNGASWTNLGSGLSAEGYGMDFASNGDLYVTGFFSQAGGQTRYYIAAWNGAVWTNVGTGLNSSGYALAVDSIDNVYAGGVFSAISGGISAFRAARWNGTAWTNLGSGLSDAVRVMAAGPGRAVYAGGDFTSSGSQPLSRVAKWDAMRVDWPGVWPAQGSILGGTRVVIAGTNLGNGVDITNVTLCGLSVTGMVEQCSTQVVVYSSAGVAGLGHAMVYSTTYGLTTKSNAYTYYVPRIVVMSSGGLVPENGAPAASSEGTDFGSLLVSQASTSRFLVANLDSTELNISGMATNLNCDTNAGVVTVLNSSFEDPVTGAYTYTPAGASWIFVSPAGVARSTFFDYAPPDGAQAGFIQNNGSLSQVITFPAPGEYRITFSSIGRGGVYGPNPLKLQIDDIDQFSWTPTKTNWTSYTTLVSIATSGEHVFEVLGTNAAGDLSSCIDHVIIRSSQTNNAPPAWFRAMNLPAVVAPGSTGEFQVVCEPSANGTQEVALVLLNDSTNFTLNVRGASLFDLSPRSGPLMGGNSLLITNVLLSGGDDITNVIVGGLSAATEAYGANWLRLTLPAHASGSVDILVQSLSLGDTWLRHAYHYHQAGYIGITTYGPYRWTNLGSGASSSVSALALNSQDDLFAGGQFTTMGGLPVSYVARWKDGVWTNLGAGLGSSVAALSADTNGSVFAGGSFTSAGGSPSLRVARWSNQAWTNVGAGFPDTVNSLVFGEDGTLYAGGSFTNSGPAALNRVARWDGSAWTNLSSGMNSGVNVLLAGTNGCLYAGGYFWISGSVTSYYIAKWDGNAWTNLGGGFNTSVSALTLGLGGELYAGGSFTYAGGTRVNYVAKWNGASWTSLGGGMNSSVYSLGTDSNGCIYAGGYFTNAGGCATRCVAKWNGVAWTNMGEGLGSLASPSVYTLAVSTSGVIYAGGSFTNAGSLRTSFVAKWAPDWIVRDPGVTPNTSPVAGGTRVVLTGSDLGNGNDITNVTLCGVTVTGMVSQCATQVVVWTGPGVKGPGDVRIFSTAFGETVKTNGFAYTESAMVVLGTNGMIVASGEPADASKGTDFGALPWGSPLIHGLSISNSGDGDLHIIAWTTNGLSSNEFQVASAPLTVLPGSVSNLSLSFNPYAAGIVTGALCLVSDDAASPFVINLAGEGLKRDQSIGAFLPSGGSVFLEPESVGLSAVASSGLPVSFETNSGPALISHGTNLSFTGRGQVCITAAQEGDANWNPAAELTHEYSVLGLFTITATYGAHGLLDPSGSVTVIEGAGTNFVISAHPYYHIRELLTNGGSDVAAAGLSCYTSWWNMVSADGTLHAGFDANITTSSPVPVPEAWLAQFGLTNFEADVQDDPDHDGQPTWEEYLASESDPTNPLSYFHAHADLGSMLISWPSASGRVYDVQSSQNVPGDPWILAEWTNLTASPPVNVVTNRSSAMTNSMQFFRAVGRME